jgi:hypothetical protein
MRCVFSGKPRTIDSVTSNGCHSRKLASCLLVSIRQLRPNQSGKGCAYAILRSRRTHRDVCTWISGAFLYQIAQVREKSLCRVFDFCTLFALFWRQQRCFESVVRTTGPDRTAKPRKTQIRDHQRYVGIARVLQSRWGASWPGGQFPVGLPSFNQFIPGCWGVYRNWSAEDLVFGNAGTRFYATDRIWVTPTLLANVDIWTST